MDKIEIEAKLAELKAEEKRLDKLFFEIQKKNSDLFGNILPQLSFLTYGGLIKEAYGSITYNIKFRRHFYIELKEDATIKSFSTSSFSANDATNNDINEIISYTKDVSTLFSFIVVNKELILNTLNSMENPNDVYKNFDSKARYDLERELCAIAKKEREDEVRPEEGKILVYCGDSGNIRDRSIIKVVSTTAKRFTFRRLAWDKKSFEIFEETKAINLDRLRPLNAKELEIVAGAK